MAWFKTPEELAVEKLAAEIKALEQAVDNMIDDEMQSRGYRDADSIGKYIGYDNQYRAECEMLGAWAASCYAKCYELLAIGEMMTAEELLEQMPKL